MSADSTFHFVTVGWTPSLVERLCNRISAKSGDRFSHILHPRYVASDLRAWPQPDVHFFHADIDRNMPEPDEALLASLERDGVPTIHNMILGDRVVSKLPYRDALAYATFLVRRLMQLFEEIKPSAVIGGFDAIHGGLAMAVARYANVPWFALNFSVIPTGLAAFCDRMNPGSRLCLVERPSEVLQDLAENCLQKFQAGRISAPAYLDIQSRSLTDRLAKAPTRVSAFMRIWRNGRRRHLLRYTDSESAYGFGAALSRVRRKARARGAISTIRTIEAPPDSPYVLFGVHMQPESSIDVWAPFYSNQMWVIELLSRSIPPTHKLLVKIHKSDVSNYSKEQLRAMRAFPGVEIVRPFVDSRPFIERAALVVAIQGTMGLEAALLGKPVIMLGESQVTLFPSASRVGEITDLPALVRKKLAEPPPDRRSIVSAYARYLAPLFPASYNNWSREITDEEIDGYVQLFDALKRYVIFHRPNPEHSRWLLANNGRP